MSTIECPRKNGLARRARLILGGFGIVSLSASLGFADAKVEETPLGPDGDVVGCAVSPHGGHVAVLAAKGSRFVVLLDGVEGPKIEGLLNNIYANIAGVGTYPNGQIPVLFSNDGSHSAYIGKVGEEFIVVEDGKELSRGPIASGSNANMVVQLEFTPGGKHLIYETYEDGKYHVVVDGKPGPATGISQPVFISPDGEHYAYGGFTNASLGNGIPNWDVVDGRQVNYIGEIQKYTARNVLVSRASADGAQILVLNGKPSIKAVGIDPMWISDDGVQVAIVIVPQNGAQPLFLVDGKEIPAAQGLRVGMVYFSPDDKHWAALCYTKTGSNCMMIDGKLGETYQSIPQTSNSGENNQRYFWLYAKSPDTPKDAGLTAPAFTPDSSEFVYVANQGGRQFLVVNEDESNAFSNQQVLIPLLSPVGHRIAVFGTATNGKQHFLIDGQDKEAGTPNDIQNYPGRCAFLSFTADGTRYAMLNGSHLTVDGEVMAGSYAGMQYLFSPDNKHILYRAIDGGANRLFLDGKIIDSSPGVGGIDRMFFSADSQHIFTTRRFAIPGTKDSTQLSVDCKPATHYAESAESGGHPCHFEFSADGVLSFPVVTDGNVRMIRVTPPSDTNVSTLLAAAKNPVDKQ